VIRAFLCLLAILGPLAAAPAAAEFEPDSAAMAAAPLTSEQEAAVAATVIRGLEKAWSDADVDAWRDLYWPDAACVNLQGGILTDRTEILERQGALWSGIFKGSTMKMKIRRVRGLARRVLLVETDNELTGYESAPPGIHPRTDGALAMRQSLVLVQRYGRWRVLSSQCTAVRTPPGE
jgi:uncharacterized protein (TIGR02246 family)